MIGVELFSEAKTLTKQEPRILLSGRYFTPEEIKQIQETVRVFSALSWHELLQTICEHLDWATPMGRNKIASCAKALEKLEREGWVQLPRKQPCRMPSEQVGIGVRTDPQEEVVGSAGDIAPVLVEPVTKKEQRQLWNEFVQRYHGLGYRRPFGAHQRYFITGGGGLHLGCLLFGQAAWALAPRDRWIGWTKQDRAQRLNWVVANTRFILFPWVHVKNLASTALSLAAKRIRKDWQDRYGYAPVLLETFVEEARYRGICYQAANWIRLGVTTGRGRMDRRTQYLSTPKVIYVYPLTKDFRSFLRGECHEQTQPSIASSVVE
jgi:hypothetical protein